MAPSYTERRAYWLHRARFAHKVLLRVPTSLKWGNAALLEAQMELANLRAGRPADLAQRMRPVVMHNHAYTVAFTLESEDFYGDDVTPTMMRAALLRRIDELDREFAWQEAVGAPFDTYKVN